MSGFQVCEASRRDVECQAIPVVMLTATEDRKLNEQAFAAGTEVCMTTPFEPDRLVTAVKMALQSAARKRLLRQRGAVQDR
jgi:CheY-like chemotaxis protein